MDGEVGKEKKINRRKSHCVYLQQLFLLVTNVEERAL